MLKICRLLNSENVTLHRSTGHNTAKDFYLQQTAIRPAPPPSPKSLVCACNNTLDSRSVCQTKHLRDISKYFSCHNLRAERNTGLCLNHKRLSETFTNNFKLQQTYRSKSELLVDSMIDIERITLPNTVGVRCVGGSWAVTFWRGGSIGRRIRVAQSA